ncbi:MAG: ABC transporter permease, partial [Spirochaeta sp.]|nr:ABC transporter permease [Spirochaeta sp.]
VGVIGEPEGPVPILEIEEIAFVPYAVAELEVAAVVERVRRHQLDMVIDFTAGEYYINTESAAGPLLRRLLESSAGTGTEPAVGAAPADSAAPADQASLTERAVAGEPIRYVDWLVPGVIGMNMMFSCLFGVGFVIVRYRKNGVLKRLKATPVPAFTFVSAQAASRLIIVVITSVVVYAGTNVFLNFMMNGSYLTLLLLTTVSILCMIAIGLVFASRIRSEELAGGLLNLITFPMIILSGVFFSLEGTPEIMQRISRALPLTHFTEGARAIMIEGAGLAEIAPNLLFLTVLTAIFLAISAVLFKWE